jgi:hypothetical protein
MIYVKSTNPSGKLDKSKKETKIYCLAENTGISNGFLLGHNG